MRKLLAIVVNDFRIRFSDPAVLVFFVIFPLVFTAVMGASMGRLLPDEQDPRAPVAVVNQDDGALALELVAALARMDELRLLPLQAGEADDRLVEREVAAILYIPPDFSQDLLAGQPIQLLLWTGTDSRVPAISQILQAEIGRVGSLFAIAQTSVAEADALVPFASPAEKGAYLEDALALAHVSLESPAATVEKIQLEVAGSRASEGFNQSSPGQLVAWSLLTFLQSAIVLVNERTMGTLQRLVVMPTSRATILIGKLLGRYCMGLIQMAILIGFGWAVFGVDWGRDPLALILVALTFALTSTSLGLMLSTLVRSFNQAYYASMVLAILLSTLAGSWFPLDITPPAFQKVASFFFPTWAVNAFTGIVVRGYGLAEVLPDIGLLVLLAAGFLGVGIWRFRYE